MTKPLLMPTLALSTALAARGESNGLLRGVRAAQAFSWGGDLALLGRSRTSFLTGVASFGVAHLAYIPGFATQLDPAANVAAPGVKAAAVTWALGAPVAAISAGRHDPALRAPVVAYAGILSTMFATSTLLRRSLPARARREIVAGSSLFLLSDTLLAVQRFLRTEPSPALESAVMATYATGQWLIAEGAVGATTPGPA